MNSILKIVCAYWTVSDMWDKQTYHNIALFIKQYPAVFLKKLPKQILCCLQSHPRTEEAFEWQRTHLSLSKSC